MSHHKTMQHTQPTDFNDATLDERDARALTEQMDIYADDPKTTSEEIAVYNKGTRHIINPLAGYCDCEDMHYRQPENGCKHLRRYDFEQRGRDIPQWVDIDALDDSVSATVVADGGQQTDARLTGPHPEFDQYGQYTGSDYWRCSGCGAEAIRRSDLDKCCEDKR